MLKIRLQRVGKKNSPSYRVVLAEHTAPPQGKFQEILGFYNPRTKEKSFKKERIEHWLSKGAQLSATVHNLLISAKVIEGIKLKTWKPKKKPEKSEETEMPKVEEKKEEEKIEEVKKSEKTEKPKEKAEEPKEKETKTEEAKIEEPKEEKNEKSAEKTDKPKEEEPKEETEKTKEKE